MSISNRNNLVDKFNIRDDNLQKVSKIRELVAEAQILANSLPTNFEVEINTTTYEIIGGKRYSFVVTAKELV